jgi:23S rRNA (guanosine2251-2'-O)-methyltransferase
VVWYNVYAEDMEESEYIYGRRTVMEALRSSPERVNKLFMAEGSRGRPIQEIRELARKSKIVIKILPKRGLEKYAPAGSHQGVVASMAPTEYADADTLIEPYRGDEPALLLALDGITDPQNFGAILRTAEAVGVNGVFIPRHRSVTLSQVAAKHSAGASQHVPVARVANIATMIDVLRDNGFQTVGTADDAEMMMYDIDFTPPTAIIIGSEGKGLRPLVRKKCEFIAGIPMHGEISSLNASVAAAVVLYEALRQRGMD